MLFGVELRQTSLWAFQWKVSIVLTLSGRQWMASRKCPIGDLASYAQILIMNLNSLISLASFMSLITPIGLCFPLWVWLLVLILVSHYVSGFCVSCTLYIIHALYYRVCITCSRHLMHRGFNPMDKSLKSIRNQWSGITITVWFCVVPCGSGGMHRLCIPRPSDRDRTHSLCRHAGRSFSNKNILVVGANIVRTWENLIDWTSAIPKPDGRKSEFCLITKRF